MRYDIVTQNYSTCIFCSNLHVCIEENGHLTVNPISPGCPRTPVLTGPWLRP